MSSYGSASTSSTATTLAAYTSTTDPLNEKRSVSASEARQRLSDLKRDMRRAAANAPQRSNRGLFKAACSTDLLFLIDTTASMMGSINAAKEQIRSIVKDIKGAFLNEAEVRVAVVGYKDHTDSTNIQFLDFTPRVDEVHGFLNTLHATGGGDLPEDVLGGIRQALNATWQQSTRCIIHIADAPAHGQHVMHDLEDTGDTKIDNYPQAGSEPHGLHFEPLIKQMVGLSINYAFLRINHYTDRMTFEFMKVYLGHGADCKLNGGNKYWSQAYSLCQSKSSSMIKSKSALQFEEALLGTTYSALRHMVVSSVTSSASRTAVRMSGSSGRPSKLDKKLDTGLGAINEDEDVLAEEEEPQMETIAPQWNDPAWFNETLVVEGFSPDIVVHNANTLKDMMANDDNIHMSITELTIRKRSRPFAQGAMRVASYAKTAASSNRFVVKSFKKGGKQLAHLAEDMRCQALCKAFALEFNALSAVVGNDSSIDFIVTTCLKGKSSRASNDECMSMEPFIEGTYVKYNNNCGYVNEDIPDDKFNQAAQAFSHFTFERSRGQFLVCDIQGVGHALTDPVIHTADQDRFRLSDTNLGDEGFKFFFSTHVCNAVCAKLGLKSNAAALMAGKQEFREKWPSMDNTVCCSNKLCGKIIRVATAKKSSEFTDYYWCDGCWLQLGTSKAKDVCVAAGPDHEFEISRFFYESQGRNTPRKCAKHREKDETYLQPVAISKNALSSGGIWNRLKTATRRRSIMSMPVRMK